MRLSAAGCSTGGKPPIPANESDQCGVPVPEFALAVGGSTASLAGQREDETGGELLGRVDGLSERPELDKETVEQHVRPFPNPKVDS
ncbi:hypothetical protein UPYG_G00282480 [Umbra pygmaea]|uniref:Uncharacterized protein n=1 Tax=Umbra pygmaea TaxID=75934 RepID=A0ABD0W7Q0_UMBPY